MYRSLSDSEIAILKQQACSAEDWKTIEVTDQFSAEQVVNTQFAGDIKIGSLTGNVEIEKGISKPAGIKNSFIGNCIIGDNVFIANVNSLVNYQIEDNVAIENVGTMVVNGKSSFGNGTEIEVLNEGGGRDLPIFDKLSSQLAYMLVVYRHDQQLIDKIQKMVDAYVDSKTSSVGIIGEHARVLNTTSVRNVNIEKYAIVTGASNLENGTIGSCEEAPAKIGEDVVAKDFIILSGSTVDSGAIVTSSFVGQGVQIGKQYSTEGSAFFANCEGFHGEACSLFAGPYTVTHHKSSLLIAGMFSFYNAGSGTNQSNHMYKLGPLHQGVVERGSKTGSFSYLLWPCRVGAFSVVMDKHGSNFDTTELPFSYITMEKGKSVITPAMNLFTVGTARDTDKWPNRDRRKDPNKLDLINFEFFSPFIIGKIRDGINLLANLHENAEKTQEFVSHKGISINRLMLRTSKRYYETAMKVYLGNEIVKRLDGLSEISSMDAAVNALKPVDSTAGNKWVDLLGMIVPETSVDTLTNQIKSDQIDNLDKLSNGFVEIFESYEDEAYAWFVNLLKEYQDISIADISKDDLIKIIADWKSNSLKMNAMIAKDSEKEFDQNSKIGFGNDGDQSVIDADFEAIRGTHAGNKFVKSILAQSEEIEKKADSIISAVEAL